MEMSPFQHLPEEILLDILVSLRTHDLLACCATCKRFQHLLKHSTLLQLIVELGVQGLRLRAYTNLRVHDGSSVDILNAFRRSQEAWKKIEPLKTATIPVSKLEYDIDGYLFAHGIASDTNSLRGISFNDLKIDSKTTPESVPIWRRIEDTGIDILDYSFDVANDLVVIVERPDRNISSDLNRLLLVTISDGGPHPQAAKTYLSFKGAPILSHCTIKIVNGYLAISLRTRHTPYGPSKVIIIIWNWKTGTLCYERDDIVGYAFLSPDTLALVVPVVEDGSNRFVGIELLRIGKENADVFLALPYGEVPSEMFVLSDNLTVDSPTILGNMPLSPFVIDETAERIIVIHLESSQLFVACRPLIRILLDESIRPLSKKPYKLPYDRAFKWRQWGPDNTVWLRMQPLSPGFVAVSGGRFCSLVNSSQPIFITNKDVRNSDNKTNSPHDEAKEDGNDELDGLVVGIQESALDQDAENAPWSILILDFNPRPILRAAFKREEADEAAKSVDNSENSWWRQSRKRKKAGKWGLESSKLTEPKIGGLPFRAYQKPMQRRSFHMILTIDHILMIAEDQTGYEVLQFID
ncbi:hypothetical protein FRC19_009234 [Serendipita sp. 401]|nr:hypothetical protein FRC19_009234 [Serendipita sp. 401]KAG9058456.1 hypothetical protein FS842_009524 [Serendipita sp. 407]